MPLSNCTSLQAGLDSSLKPYRFSPNTDYFILQVFVETLDKCFENVCELDLIFHVDKVKLMYMYIKMYDTCPRESTLC